jgi:ubiquitin carboxyl-terminal hydrolase 1
MSSQEDHLLRDLYGDDYKYHRDYSRGDFHWPKFVGSFIPVTLLILGLVYTGFYLLDFDLLPLPELLWNWIVYITPSRILDLLDHDVKGSAMADSSFRSIPRTHAAKSESIRRILGFDKSGGIMGSVAQAGRRRLSSLPGMRMGIQGEDGRPPGLGNWDNSCYQNSVLQGLASLDSLSSYLSGPKSQSDNTGRPDMKMADSLRNLIAELKDPLNNGKRIWTPATLKSMSSWQQQDAQEYFSKVLDEIDKEITKVTKAGRSLQGLEASDVLKMLPEKGIGISVEGTAAEAGVRNPLEGLLAQRVGCTRCGYSEGLSMIPFNCLTVPLGKAWYYDISECLDEYTKLETIEGVECGRCTLLKTQRLLSILLERIKDSPDDSQVRVSTTTRLKTITEVLEEDDYDDKTLTQKCNLPPKNRMSTTKSRQAVIARPPKSLAIHVNRSLFDEQTGELKKNYAEVRFPKTLDLGPWCLGSTGKTQDIDLEEWLLDPEQSMISGTQNPSRVRGPIYELRAVVTHYGRHENGHYICYRKHPVVHDIDEKNIEEEQWWRLSDDDVMKVSEDNVLGQGGIFMLFYDCVEPSSPMSSQLPIKEIAFVTENSTEVLLAASIPLPEDSDDDLDTSDIDEQNSSPLSREESIATTTSEFGDDAPGLEQDYLPTKPIIIPPRIQSSVIYRDEDGKQQRMRSSGSMVMV